MKKQLIIATLALGAIVFGTNKVQAQDVNPAQTTVNITLADVISILPGSTANGGEINFTYSNAEDYHTIQTVSQSNALIVTSTKSFDIDVKAEGENFTDGTNNIPVGVMNIRPVSGGNTTMNGLQSEITLTNSNQKIVSSADLGSELVLDLEYEIPAAKASSPDILGKPAATYVQTVTYTATAL